MNAKHSGLFYVAQISADALAKELYAIAFCKYSDEELCRWRLPTAGETPVAPLVKKRKTICRGRNLKDFKSNGEKRWPVVEPKV